MSLPGRLDREYLLKILRLNMIPAPRVLTPGPATVFPILYETSSGVAVVETLKEVRSASWTGGFFREKVEPVERLIVRVEGYDAPCVSPIDPATASLAVRAVYCLGLDSADVEIGVGPGGPWVLDVTCPLEAPRTATSPAAALPGFLGARAEYLRVDPATGEPVHEFCSVAMGPSGEPDFPQDAATDRSTWVSSPMPFDEMPLTTVLCFSGVPAPHFVRLLDWTIAVSSMLSSPREEARERHATEEGLLGSVRLVRDGYEYRSVPSLLWNPEALRRVVADVVKMCAETSGEIPRPELPLPGPRLEEIYEAQKAYYNCDRGYFRERGYPVYGKLGDEGDERLVEDVTGYGDLRSAWGFEVGHAPAEIGPGSDSLVLGIMSPPYDGPRRFGIETDRFKEIVKAAEEAGAMAYVFFPDPWTGRAWFYRDRRGWFEADAPLPNVVYDRHIPDVLPAGIRDVAREFQEAHPETKFVNSLPFVRACRDKFAAHSILSAEPSLARYLPETILADDPQAVADFVSPRRRTYLKLRGGTGSKGLVLIENDRPGKLGESSGGRYKVARREGAGAASRVTQLDDAGLLGFLRDLIAVSHGPGADYIAQDGIDLVRVPEMGEVFEVRVVCQKGGAGLWLRTGMVCRLNPVQGLFIIPREELHFRVDDLLSRVFPPGVFPGRVSAIKREIREMARIIPPLIERCSGPGGEMSVDLGIDTCGRPHLIEVNSKPATLFRDIGAFGLRQLSLRRIVNYSIRLFERR